MAGFALTLEGIYRSWNPNLKLAGILVGGYASRVFLAVPVVVGAIVSTLIR